MARKPKIAVKYKVATAGRQKPTHIVLHDTESHDYAGVRDIQGIADYWQRQGRGLGAHFIIDKDGNIGQGAGATSKTQAAYGHNTGAIHIELIGFARFSPNAWFARPKQLAALVDLLAYLTERWDIRPVHDIERGVAKHADYHDVPAEYYHSDPGPGFPFRHVMRRVRKQLAAG